jgi:uncharacterized caspase-like protein
MKTRKVILLLLMVPLLSLYSLEAQNNAGPEKRLALVIGNSAYTYAMELTNPVNDARAMKESLQKLGFDVDEYEDLDQAGLKRVIDFFGEKLKKYSVGLFFYAGHGIQSKGSNYLIPVNAKIESEQQIDYDCVQADRVLGQMEAAGSIINIVILDACRNNPFERSWSRAVNGNGLAFMNAPSGSLIAYSTSPGRTASDGSGSNGLYTAALLENLKTPGINILQMFQNVRRTVASKSDKQQIPWESTSLTNDFFFVDNSTNISAQQDISNNHAVESVFTDARNESGKNLNATWKHDEKVFWLYLNGTEIEQRVIGSWNNTDWLVYDPVTKNTFLLPDYSKRPLNQILPAKVLGNFTDAWWRFDSTYYYLYVKGELISARTKRFAIDNDLLVYDEPTNTTYILKDFTHCKDNQLRPATLFDNADFAFWRRQDNTYWLYVKGEEIQFRTKNSVANNDLLVYDPETNITYLFEGYYTEQKTNQLKPARVISYMDDVLWMRNGNTYWVFSKGDMISPQTINYKTGNDLNVTDTLNNVKYILYDYFNTGNSQFKPAFKLQ